MTIRQVSSVMCLCCLSAFAAGMASAVTQAAPHDSIKAALQPFVDQHAMAGAVAAVADKDKLLYLDAVGCADLATRKPMAADNIFWIASMTKSFTATALMMLVDEGKVNIDDPVEKYLPEFKGQMLVDENGKTRPPRRPITIKDCLTHTSGVAAVRPHFVSLRADVTAIAAAPLISEPGVKYKYSNNGIETVGRIIEVVSGMPYAEFIRTRILDPLGMKDTTFWPDQKQVDRLAKTSIMTAGKTGLENLNQNVGHQEDRRVPSGLLSQQNMDMIPTYVNHYAGPAGGLFSTAADVIKFCRMVLDGGVCQGKRLLSSAAVREMTSNQTGDILVGGDEAYGLGWSVKKKKSAGELSIGSFGHRGARKTVMWIDPQRQLVMVLLLQSFDMPGNTERDLHNAFTKAAIEEFGR